MADIHNIGVTALNVYQRALNMTGHNVANVHTPGYSRQRSEPVAQDTIFAKGYYLGTGVKDTAVVRAYDDFLLGQMRASQSAKSDAQAFYRIGSQVNRLIAGENTGLDPMLQGFFDAVQTLADDPASTPVRELLLAESQALVDRFRFLDGSLNRARDEVHSEIRNAVGEVNNLARTIAQLNKDISDSFGIHQGIWPNDLLDQRDNAINELTRYISINTIKQDDGTTTVYFGKGQPLVLGEESHSLSVVDSSLIPNHKEIAYVSGGVGGITSDQIAGGELEGLLRARDQFLEQGRNQLGLVALGLSMEVNAQHREGINLMDQTGLDFFSDLSVTQSTDSYLNAAGSDYLFDITVTDLTRLSAADFSL